MIQKLRSGNCNPETATQKLRSGNRDPEPTFWKSQSKNCNPETMILKSQSRNCDPEIAIQKLQYGNHNPVRWLVSNTKGCTLHGFAIKTYLGVSNMASCSDRLTATVLT